MPHSRQSMDYADPLTNWIPPAVASINWTPQRVLHALGRKTILVCLPSGRRKVDIDASASKLVIPVMDDAGMFGQVTYAASGLQEDGIDVWTPLS